MTDIKIKLVVLMIFMVVALTGCTSNNDYSNSHYVDTEELYGKAYEEGYSDGYVKGMEIGEGNGYHDGYGEGYSDGLYEIPDELRDSIFEDLKEDIRTMPNELGIESFAVFVFRLQEESPQIYKSMISYYGLGGLPTEYPYYVIDCRNKIIHSWFCDELDYVDPFDADFCDGIDENTRKNCSICDKCKCKRFPED